MNVPFLDTLPHTPLDDAPVVVSAIQLAPVLADALEAHVERSWRSKKQKASGRPALVAKLLPKLFSVVVGNGPARKGRNWETSLEAALMAPEPLESIRATFNAMVAVEDKVRGLGFDCPLKWALYPSATWRPEMPESSQGAQVVYTLKDLPAALAENFKPFRNYFFGVRACWSEEDVYLYGGDFDDDFRSTNALTDAQNFVTKMMLNALVGAQR